MRTLLCLAVVAVSLAHAQSQLNVPSDHATIQGAIAAAANGDTVVIAPGTYFETDIDFLGKAIVVRSSVGPEVTVVNAGSAGCGFVFQSGEGSGSVLEGLTLTNSILFAGGTAVRVQGASPRVFNCTITGFRAFAAPGGAFVSGSPEFEHCRFVGNATTFGQAAGVEIAPSGPLPAIFRSCRIEANVSASAVGGVNVRTGAVAEFHSCVFVANCGTFVGSALQVSGTVTLDGCTVAGHFSPGCVAVDVNAQLTIANSIVWGNGAIGVALSGLATATHSNIEHGQVPGTDLIDTDPLFVDLSAGDIDLLAGSPCIDAADPTSVGAATGDHVNDPRVFGAAHDMGADEFLPVVYPGTAEDLELATRVDGVGDPAGSIKSIAFADRLMIEFTTPNATFVGATPVILAQLFATGLVPTSPFPGIWMDPTLPNAPIVALFDPVASGGPFGPLGMPVGGISLHAVIPASLIGTSVLIQGYVFSANAANAIFAGTNGHELRGI